MDEFRLSNYLKTPEEDHSFSGNIQVQMAKDWATDAIRTIIYPVNNLRDLESLWMKFELMPYDDRRESDDKSLEIFGMTNQQHYEMMKSEFLKDDIENPTIEDLDELNESAGADFSSEEGINYTPVDVEYALDWATRSGYPMIYPTRNLEELKLLWDNFNSYPIRIRVMSDTESIRFFGINNERHYNYLKSQFLKDDIEKPEIIEESFIGDPIDSHKIFAMNEEVGTLTRAKDLLSLVARKNENYEEALIQNIIDKATKEYVATHQNFKYDVLPFEDLPFFTPDEMIDFGVGQANPENNFYGCDPIANVISEDYDEWFYNYCNACVGLAPFNSIGWKDDMYKISHKLKFGEDNDQVKQAALHLGWPAEIEYSPENRVKATKRLKMKLSDNIGSTQFVDLTDMNAEDISEAAVDSPLKPFFIVLEEGTTAFSNVIKKLTKSTYSHAAISFDPSMKKMYSYGIEDSVNGVIGGFIEEHIEDKNPDKHMAVFTIFLKEDDWNKLKSIVEDFMKNAKKTSYGYANLVISHVFKIPMNMDKQMVCSQFVDKILKLIDVDISKKNSSLVSPADFEKFAKENKKIYVLFDDFVKKFKPGRIKALTTRLLKKAEPIKESILWTDPVGIVFEMINNIHSLEAMQELSTKIDIDHVVPSVKKIYESMIAPCLEAEVYLEAKNLPIQFDKHGNMYINGIRKTDYEKEYRKSHQALRQYKKVGPESIDSIKYELFKLQAMVDAIDRKLEKKESKELIDTRARIINDLTYYTELAMQYDPKFNFYKEYKKSEFYDSNIRINNHTLKASGKVLKALMKSLI